MTQFRNKALFVAAFSYALFTLLILGAAQVSAQGAGGLDFENCFSEGVARQVKCYEFMVPENWDDPEGPQISLNLVVVPAQGAKPEPDPLILFAGGPGQAAGDMAKLIPFTLARVNQKRDIILLDQRGTGKSTPLTCEITPATVASIPDTVFGSTIQACVEGFEADMRFFTSFDAIRDIEFVREALGIEKLNIWGGSYGTRLGLLYMKLHPGSIRSAILDGVTAPNSKLFVSAPDNAEASWQALVRDCQADPACRSTFPALDDRLRGLLDGLAEDPQKVEFTDLWSGADVEVVIDRDWLAETVRSALYIPKRAAILPFALSRAEKGDFRPFMALAQDGNFWAGSTMAVGSTLAILCSEELPRNSAAEAAKSGESSFHGDYYFRIWAKACEGIPTRDVLAGYEDPVETDIPTLILSGGLDPVTPPSQGEIAAGGLTNSWHLISENSGHGVTYSGCAPRLIAQFIEAASAENIDTACINDIVRPAFLINPLTYRLSADREENNND